VEPQALVIACNLADLPGDTCKPIRPLPSEKSKEECKLAADVEVRMYDVLKEKVLRRFFRYSLFAHTDAGLATIDFLAP
jgi:hypothetical protein